MRIVFMGTPKFAAPTLEALCRAGHQVPLVVTQPDRIKGRGKKPSPPEVKAAALELNLKTLQPEKMADPGVTETLADIEPDAIVVVAFGFILKRDVLDLPRLGCINGHASLLPKYRGAAPIQWAIAEGEDKTGVTAMLMDEGMDTGDILMQKEVGIDPDDTCGSLHDKLAPVTADLLVEALERLAAGSIKPMPQDHERATYAPMLKKQDGKIDWTMTANKIALRVRAFDPWPGTFTMLEDQPLKVMRAEAEREDPSGVPGSLMRCDKNGIVVSCGEGALRITEIQPPGKRRMNAAEYLAGHCLETGTLFK
jgi:methionyl-tRNA formyltransferase